MDFSFNAPPHRTAAVRHAIASGNLAHAEDLCRRLLADNPRDTDALHLLGLVAWRAGRLDDARSHLQAAAVVDPRHASALTDLAELLRTQGELTQALATARRAVEANPQFGPAHLVLAVLLSQSDSLEAAAAEARLALALLPNDATAASSAGRILFRLGQHLESARQSDPQNAPATRTDLAAYLEAAACFEQALRRNPQDIPTCTHLALAYERLELYDRAYHVQKYAADARPNDLSVVLGMGHLLTRLSWLEEAELYTRKALAIDPVHAAARENLATVLLHRGKFAEAAALAQELLAEDPASESRQIALAHALSRLGRFDEALALLRQSVSPTTAGLQALASIHLRQADASAALEAIDQAIALDPYNLALPFDKGIILQALGRLAESWPLLEYRWRNPLVSGRARHLTAPRWDGRPLPGQRIVLLAEQGLGDTLLFARYATLIREQGGLPVLWCPAPLVELLKTVPGIEQVIPEGPNLADLDAGAWLPLMSVAGVLGTTLDTVPGRVPYLSADPAKAEQWRRTLSVHPGRKVGLAWECSPGHPEKALRSIPPEAFSALAGSKNVTFFSLQKHSLHAPAPALPAGIDLVDLGARLRDFTDTAAIIENLDLVITVDTAVAHLAGAMAKPVWILLALSSGPLWMFNRPDTPWYPTARLFRQTRFNDWPEVLSRVRAALEMLQRS